MEIPVYQVDAFTSEIFGGNPAAVCPLDRWPDTALLQQIAAENNLSETAYFVPSGGAFELRWFTPTVEVNLCGHATLAAAYVLFTELAYGSPTIRFETQSGPLTVVRRDGRFVLDFPSYDLEPVEVERDLAEGLGVKPGEAYSNRDLMAVLGSEEEVLSVRPNMEMLANLDALVIIVTAPGTDCDFVSRCFSPRGGIPEDPVTGSAHCSLIPYWARRLDRTELHARQRSWRGGELFCRSMGSRVEIAGNARLFMKGRIYC